MSDPVIGQKQTAEEPGEGVVDASDRSEGGGVVVWWNDIEKDSRYKQWPSSLTGVSQPMKSCVFGGTDFVVSSSDISRPAPYHSQKHLERNHGARSLFIDVA